MVLGHSLLFKIFMHKMHVLILEEATQTDNDERTNNTLNCSQNQAGALNAIRKHNDYHDDVEWKRGERMVACGVNYRCKYTLLQCAAPGSARFSFYFYLSRWYRTLGYNTVKLLFSLKVKVAILSRLCHCGAWPKLLQKLKSATKTKVPR